MTKNFRVRTTTRPTAQRSLAPPSLLAWLVLGPNRASPFWRLLHSLPIPSLLRLALPPPCHERTDQGGQITYHLPTSAHCQLEPIPHSTLPPILHSCHVWGDAIAARPPDDAGGVAERYEWWLPSAEPTVLLPAGEADGGSGGSPPAPGGMACCCGCVGVDGLGICTPTGPPSSIPPRRDTPTIMGGGG